VSSHVSDKLNLKALRCLFQYDDVYSVYTCGRTFDYNDDDVDVCTGHASRYTGNPPVVDADGNIIGDNIKVPLLTSTSDDDTVDGDGARKVKITGLDGFGNYKEDIFDLIGTKHELVNRSFFRRVFTAEVVEAGNAGANIGTITIDAWRNPAILYGVIEPRLNAMFNSTWTCPEGYVALLVKRELATMNVIGTPKYWKELATVVRRRAKTVWEVHEPTLIYANQGIVTQEFECSPVVLYPGDDIAVRVLSKKGGAIQWNTTANQQLVAVRIENLPSPAGIIPRFKPPKELEALSST